MQDSGFSDRRARRPLNPESRDGLRLEKDAATEARRYPLNPES